MRLLPILPLCAVLMWLCACSDPAPGPPGLPVRILCLYAQSDTGRFVDYPARIRAVMGETQTVFHGSDTRVYPEIAGIRVIPFEPAERIADLQALVRQRDGRMDGVHAIRDSLEADIVVLFSALPKATINGSILATAATAFVIVAWEDAGAPDYGLAHELAHLFGAMHPGTLGPVADQLPAGFPWGNDTIRTVMDWNPGRTVPYFSNPGKRHGESALGTVGKQDIASVIRLTGPYIANFRGRITPTEFVPAGTLPSADFSE